MDPAAFWLKLALLSYKPNNLEKFALCQGRSISARRS
jgi:hypothetical protein